jgi:hypothetical protein
MNIRSKIFGGGNAAEEPVVVKAKKPKGAKAETLNSIPVIREETRRGNTREADRHRLPDQEVRITHNGRSLTVALINLSGGGAMVEGDFEPLLWDRVDLHLGENGTTECVVRWLRGGRVGLEFAHETRLDCSADEQAAVLREVITKSFPDIEFEGPVGAGSSPSPRSSSSSSSRDSDGSEQRTSRRHPLIWSGQIHHDYQSTPVRLRNISQTGAMIECTIPLHVGVEPLLDLGEAGQVFATVTWVFGDAAGLRFHEPFDLAHLARSKPEVASGRWERPSYLQPGQATDSPWDDKWGRMSLGELRQDLEGFLKR